MVSESVCGGKMSVVHLVTTTGCGILAEIVALRGHGDHASITLRIIMAVPVRGTAIAAVVE